MRVSTPANSGRYDGDGRRLGFNIRPSARQCMRNAFKRDTAERRAYALQARLIEKAEGSGFSSARHVDPRERAILVNRLRRPEMTDDEIDELAHVVDAYLGGALSAADWRLWLVRMRGI
jgi:hypothetical protein